MGRVLVGIGLGLIATDDYTTLYWAPVLLRGKNRKTPISAASA